MDLKNLSNNDLISRFGKLVQTERKITHLVLECIAEIDFRKIYLEKAYPSLYEFLTSGYGYSPSAALRRIESARLVQEIPEICKKIEEGALNLSQVSKVQQAIRNVQKLENRKVPTLEKIDLLKKIEFTTQYQAEVIIAKELSLPVIAEEKQKVHLDESVTLTVQFSKDQIDLLKRVQGLVAHSVPGGKWSGVLVYLAQKELDQRTKVKRSLKLKKQDEADSSDLVVSDLKSEFASKEGDSNMNQNAASNSMGKIRDKGAVGKIEKTPSMLLVKFPKRIAIRASLRKTILQTQKCCQFRNLESGKICGSTQFLQVDHIKPVWAGGTNEAENLRLLCANHNQYRYQKESNLHPLRR